MDPPAASTRGSSFFNVTRADAAKAGPKGEARNGDQD
jgi:hypothetical protein